MKMRLVDLGKIESPGDFSWRRLYGPVEGRPSNLQIALYCPKCGMCSHYVQKGDAAVIFGTKVWGWDGCWDAPTITPSIGCDAAPRCGAHMVIAKGNIEGVKLP